MSTDHIRNFCIIAHIDHGKSTLADRMLQLTGTVTEREMKEQFLDKIDLERERGITIKLQAVRMNYETSNNDKYVLNLIDTPGHIDFSYEVSRALEACEGALLLVDASQGVQAQTLANYAKARNANLKIIPVVNKIDLPAAHPDDVALDLVETFGFDPDDIVFVSGKTGEGVVALLDAIVQKIPKPTDSDSKKTKALVFDSYYDQHKGVIAVVRVMNGEIIAKESLTLIHTNKTLEPLEIGYISSKLIPTKEIKTGEVGYIATGLKDVNQVRVGETLTQTKQLDSTKIEPLAGYKEPKPMVYANLFPADADQLAQLRDAVEKYNLTDAAFTFEPFNSPVLGSGFRCGFLGLLHLDVVRERIETEFEVETQITSPSVVYNVQLRDGSKLVVQSAEGLPDQGSISEVQEPWCEVKLFTTQEHIGNLMKVTQKHRAELVNMQHFGDRAEIVYKMPLAEVIANFFDQIKSVSSGYASLDYEVTEYRPSDLVKIEILLNHETQESLSRLVVREHAEEIGRKLVEKLKETLPQQQFKLPIQAAIGGRVIARETLSALRKDVTAKLYGGDRTRKDKLLKKQAKGKKKMQELGRVKIPNEVYKEIVSI